MNNPIHLGVNIDHVATLRQARGTAYPSPRDAVRVVEAAGADSITVHLREDRRHIQDADLSAIAAVLQTRMNLEMAVTDEMLEIATALKPRDVCLVPERRAELTTEGGLDLCRQRSRIAAATAELGAAGIRVSLFIDPDARQIEIARDVGAPVVELHTGAYCDADGEFEEAEYRRVADAARYAAELGLVVNAGHGLNYDKVRSIAAIPEIVELNIGHAIVARALFDGLATAVAAMKRLMLEARNGAAA